MKKFQFSLERVFRYHQQRLKQAEFQLTKSAAERERALSDVRDCQHQIDQSCQLNESVGHLINPAIRANVTAHLEHLTRILMAARDRLKIAEQRFRETERVRAKMTQEVERFTHLRDLRKQEHRAAVDRNMQIEIDEVVMRKWSVAGDDDGLLSTEMLE